MIEGTPSTPRLAFTIFLPFACGYFLSFLYRTVNAVLAPTLTADVGLTASDLGLLTSAYFLTFAAFQLPLGALLDRFGPRRVQATLFIFAAAGAALFSVGDSLWALIAGRGLIGFGVAGGLMGSFKVITLWYPKRLWPVLNGMILGVGGIGAMTATKPVELALGFTDWRGIFLVLACLTVLAALFIFFAVPERPRRSRPPAFLEQVRGFRVIFTDRLFWSVVPLTGAANGVGLGLGTLWVGPWLADVGGHDEPTVAVYLLAMTSVLTVGFFSTGIIASWLDRHGFSLMKTMGTGFVIFLSGQAAITFAIDPGALWPWLIFGYFNHIGILSYPYMSGHFPPEYSGRANTALNVLTFLSAFATQYFVGAMLDQWPATSVGSYHPDGYFAAFGILMILQLAAFIWFITGLKTIDREKITG
ncbi:MAG: MFS transporter [Rhodospirillales bacterium]|jgi:MFS family permease